MKSATTAGWPAKVRRRDGTLAPFDIARIEAAVARAAREVAYDDPDMPVTVARAVADALGPRIAPVEEIQDFVEARLGEAGLDDVARAYIIYRQRRAELRTAKALLGVRDELKLSLAAVTVLRERYLLRDEQGRPTESTGRDDGPGGALRRGRRGRLPARLVDAVGGALLDVTAQPRIPAEFAHADERRHRHRSARRLFRSAR